MIQTRTARRMNARVVETQIPAMAAVVIVGAESGVGEGPGGVDAVLDGTGIPGRGVNPNPESVWVSEADTSGDPDELRTPDDCVLSDPAPAARVLDEDVVFADVLDDDDVGTRVTVDTLPLSEIVAVTTTAGWNKSSYWMLHRTNSSLAS